MKAKIMTQRHAAKTACIASNAIGRAKGFRACRIARRSEQDFRVDSLEV